MGVRLSCTERGEGERRKEREIKHAIRGGKLGLTTERFGADGRMEEGLWDGGSDRYGSERAGREEKRTATLQKEKPQNQHKQNLLK